MNAGSEDDSVWELMTRLNKRVYLDVLLIKSRDCFLYP